MVSLAQKLKLTKTYQKRFFHHIKVVLCKTPLEKNTKYLRNETILKISHLPKAIAYKRAIASLCEIVALAEKLKLKKKNAKNDSAFTV